MNIFFVRFIAVKLTYESPFSQIELERQRQLELERQRQLAEQQRLAELEVSVFLN